MATPGRILVPAVLVVGAMALAGQIENTPHNLSVTGPGQVRALQEAEICIFCHTPHNAIPAAPLWNRDLSGAVYSIYDSSTLDANPGQPTGASKLCLSCHDGTIAVGAVRSRATPIAVTGAPGGLLAGNANLGTDLSDDHPVSFSYDASVSSQDTQIADPNELPSHVHLDPNGELQCTACHDPHDNQYGKFLVMDNTASALCVVCHRLTDWSLCSHRTSSATWNGGGIDPWPDSSLTTVSANACGNCHVPHHAGHPARLLRQTNQEDTCLACHDGSVAASNIDALLSQSSRHDVRQNDNVHDPREDPTNAPQHVECADCHNPHACRNNAASAPAVSGALQRTSGVNSAGGTVVAAQFEYQVCYKCHADNPNRVESTITRQITQSNVRLEFDPGAVSYHPVETAGRNPDVPSLIPPRRTTDIIYCSDCHGSSTSKKAGGSGPDGPHGSPYRPILLAQYKTTDGASESPTAYALCYRCHSRNSILNNDSFKEHKRHIVNVKAPCSACHDAHGISSGQGTATNNSHLINFDTSIVETDPGSGKLAFEDLGDRTGQCFLRCHNNRHSPRDY